MECCGYVSALQEYPAMAFFAIISYLAFFRTQQPFSE